MSISIKNMKFIILVISFHFQWAIAQELSNHVIADANSTYHVFWSVDGENITFEVQVATKGYVGFGFSPNGGMPGSDIVIGWVLPNGQVYFQDRHAIGFYEPLIDSEQNYNLLNAFENETHTVFRFTRKLNTCDKENDTVITDSTMKIIYCWHPDDPQSLTNVHYHGTEHRGARNVLLLNPQIPFEITEDITMWDVQMPNVTILPKITTLWCLGVKLPQFMEPHYYVGNTILVTPGNENIVHHIVVNECRGNTKLYEDKYQQHKNGYDCSNSGERFEGIDCVPQIFGFSLGSQGLFYPKDVGRPLGEENGGASYFIFQTHYNNVEKKQGIVDGTTVRLYLTKKNVTNKAGTMIMVAPVDYTFLIPPRQPEFKISTYCPSECTSNGLPKEGITIFGVKVHSHLAGIKLSIRHFRNNKELVPIVVEDNYDFNYQLIRQLSETVKVLQGDMLMGTCVYSSMDRNETTLGGMGSADEMCSFTIYHYPMVDLRSCIVQANYNATNDYFGVEVAEDEVHIVAPAALQNQSIFDVIRYYDWTTVDDIKFNKMASMQYDARKNVACYSQSAMLLTVPIGYPTDIPPYISPPDVCDNANDTIKTSTVDI